MAFGKVGRPPKDRVAQQERIFRTVAPLILELGAGRLSMQEVASVSELSIGGLYHYFPTKREVVLHGLSEEAGERMSRDFRRQVAEFPGWSHESCLNAFLDQTVRRLSFLHPSVQAALELGVEDLQPRMEAALESSLAELRETLELIARGMGEREREAVARAVRRVLLGALVEREVQGSEVRDHLRMLIKGHMTRRTPGRMI